MIYTTKFVGRLSSHSRIIINNSTSTFFIFYNYTFTTLMPYALRLEPYASRFHNFQYPEFDDIPDEFYRNGCIQWKPDCAFGCIVVF